MTSPTALRAEALAARLPPLVVAADRVASTVLQGVHGRRRAGVGDAFWQFRPFLPGDSVTRVDWRQSAKTDRLFIRETEWEAAQTVALWSDASRSMEHAFSRDRPTKRARADLLLSALAALLLRGGERVRLMGLGASRSHAGRAGLNGVVEGLAAIDKSGALPAPDASLPRHARIVLIGDFLTPLPDIHAAVAALAGWPLRGHLVQVLDPDEETLGAENRAFAGRVRFEWGSGEGVLVPRVEAVRDEYLARMARHRAGLAGIAAELGWSLLVHHTDQPPEAALLALWRALAPQQ